MESSKQVEDNMGICVIYEKSDLKNLGDKPIDKKSVKTLFGEDWSAQMSGIVILLEDRLIEITNWSREGVLYLQDGQGEHRYFQDYQGVHYLEDS